MNKRRKIAVDKTMQENALPQEVPIPETLLLELDNLMLRRQILMMQFESLEASMRALSMRINAETKANPALYTFDARRRVLVLKDGTSGQATNRTA